MKIASLLPFVKTDDNVYPALFNNNLSDPINSTIANDAQSISYFS